MIDFIALRDTLQEITSELDHHVLLPDSHETIKVDAHDKEVMVTFEDRRWVFPKDDCIILPISNTTAELLARHIGKELLRRFELKGTTAPDKLIVGVDENEGQWGICELDLDS